MDAKLLIRPTSVEDVDLIKSLIAKHWGGEPLVIRGENYYPSTLDGLLAFREQEVVGFLIYDSQGQSCEIIVFEVLDKFKGIGTKMLERLQEIAVEQNCKKLLVMTTNDNLDALRFYQRRGFVIAGIHLGSMDISRKMKPSIPMEGDYGIACRDEIDLELSL